MPSRRTTIAVIGAATLALAARASAQDSSVGGLQPLTKTPPTSLGNGTTKPQATSGTGTTRLPATGYDAGLVAVGGAGLMLAGVALRLRLRRA